MKASVHLTVGALRIDAELEVGAGEVVAVVGPNGAGKTTLLRALAGLVALEGGTVRLDGDVLDDVASVVHLAPERRRVSLCFQDGLLFPHLDALDNVAFGPRRRGTPRAAARRLAGAWLSRVGVEARAHARASELSGGEARRVALARALITEPRLLLLDEPLSGLDASTNVGMRRELRRCFAETKAAVVVVTHDPIEAMTLATRLVVIVDGQIVQEGAPGEITARPRSRYVADLVGVNLFRGIAAGDQVTTPGGGALTVPTSATGEVFAAVHPRAVTLYRRQPDGSPRNVWTGTVEAVDREGDRARVLVAGPLPIVAEVTAGAVADLDLAPGAPVWVAVKATEIDVYPA